MGLALLGANRPPKLQVKALLLRLRPHASRSGWALVDALISPALSLAVAPFLLRHIGTAGFGLWAFAVAIAGFGGIASIGVGVATTKYVSEHMASGRGAQATDIARAALTVALLGGMLLLSATALVSPLLASTLFGRLGSASDVQKVLVLGVALLALQEVDGVFSGALRGAQRFDVTASVEVATRIAWAISVIVVAWRTESALATLGVSVGVNAVKVAIKGWAAQMILRGPAMVPSLSMDELRRLLRFGKWLWIQGLGGLLFSVADRLLIGAIFGAADLARYSICVQLSQLVHGTQAAALQTIVPWLSSRLALDRGLDRKTTRRIAIAGGLGCTAIPLLFMTFSTEILGLWIGREFAEQNSPLCTLLLGAYGLLSFSIPCHFLLLGFGHVRFLAFTNILAGVIGLSASLLGAQSGVEAFAVGKILFAGFILLNFVMLHRIVSHQP